MEPLKNVLSTANSIIRLQTVQRFLMRVRLFPFFLLLILVISGCALDYNDYPYSEQPQAVPVSTVTEEPVPTASEDVPAVVAEETTTVASDSSTSTESAESTSVDTGDVPPAASQEDPVTVIEPASEPAEESVAEPQTVIFDVSASQFSFTPDTLTVRKGDTVVINLSTVDVPHGFAVTDFGFSLSATTPGQVVSGSFVADTVGTFTFFCNVTCGTGHDGMKGTLVVTE